MTPHDARVKYALPLLEWFRETRHAYIPDHPLDSRRTADTTDENDIVCFAQEAITAMEAIVVDAIEQIEVRMEDIATRRRVS